MERIIIKLIVAKLRYFGIKYACKYLSGLYLTLYSRLFQNFSNALTKLERQVSIQGISLMNGFFGKRVYLAYNDLFCKAKFCP